MRVFGALWLGLRGRRAVPAGARTIGYAGGLTLPLVIMVVLAVVEIAAGELLVPWWWLRLVLLVPGVYGLLWVLGFLASTRVYPHAVGPAELLLRFACLTEVAVPLGKVGAVRKELCGRHEQSIEVEAGTLSFAVLGTTGVVVELTEPHEVDLGKRGRHLIERIRLYADDPAAAVTILSGARLP
ncbi:hypothetical protein [Crossiella cryophila]|uniref:DUF304 domain-containing protein n=1 Tax=Crossiella cryophila TaxID=43355 RepID=A0A7W7C834_9PSEU|nr:hypothetical protein [Crossiella cryophila]MBB4676226.1 hypothetical protein [Crossiella cryophila]